MAQTKHPILEEAAEWLREQSRPTAPMRPEPQLEIAHYPDQSMPIATTEPKRRICKPHFRRSTQRRR